MKKTIITSIVLTSLSVGVLLFSCKKQETIQPQNQLNGFNVSVKNDRLVFSTVADYQKAVDNPTAETRQNFLKTVNQLSFTPLNKKAINATGELAALIHDEYFKTILNQDMVVQIGNHIYRVNPLTEKVYVLPVANEDR